MQDGLDTFWFPPINEQGSDVFASSRLSSQEIEQLCTCLCTLIRTLQLRGKRFLASVNGSSHCPQHTGFHIFELAEENADQSILWQGKASAEEYKTENSHLETKMREKFNQVYES